MHSARLLSALIPGATRWAFGLVPDTHTKPKSTSFGRTIEDLQTHFASSCIKQADQDIINGTSSIHVEVCEGGQQICRYAIMQRGRT
jgi:hypothetical protein